MCDRTKRATLSMIALITTVFLCGCNTVKGVGEDIKTVGGLISGSAQHVENSIQKNPPGSGMTK